MDPRLLPLLPPSNAGGLLADRVSAVNATLRSYGAGAWDLRKGETAYLITLLHSDEVIGGVAYGHGSDGSVLLVATDRRVLYLDTKPLFKKAVDISYDAVAGVTLEWVAFFGTLILQTRIGNFAIRMHHRNMAEQFKAYVEQRCIEHSQVTDAA